MGWGVPALNQERLWKNVFLWWRSKEQVYRYFGVLLLSSLDASRIKVYAMVEHLIGCREGSLIIRLTLQHLDC